MTATQKNILALCLLPIVFCGCAAAPKMTARLDVSSPEAALEHLAVRLPADALLMVLADVRVATEAREGAYPLKLALLLKKPASLRVEAIPLFGPPAFFLSVRDRTMKVFLPQNNAFYIGRATPENVRRFLPLKMGPEELVALLTGTGQAPSGPDRLLRGRPEGDHYRIDLVEPRTRRSLWVRMTDGFLERLEVYEGDKRLYRVHFEEPFHTEGTVLPQKITFVSEGIDGVSMSIRYREIHLLTDVDPEAFDLETPPGVEPAHLD
ncbi:MAG: hypothetical protein C0394_09430 [Syntrophus sp. (in: bacteria)]|nr:hypothetical protein [Syntrophus sp. (in: bacteria)]